MSLITNPRRIGVLGSTGSVGRNTLELVASQLDMFELEYITAGSNADELIKQAIDFKPKHVVIQNEAFFEKVKSALSPYQISVHAGNEAIQNIAKIPVDIVMAAIVGLAGLRPLMNAIQNSKTVAIANKEPLVAAGDIVMEFAKLCGTKILPVDSEHNAIFQVFENQNRNSIVRLILTASGGPFRHLSLDDIKHVSIDQALAHPNWVMGQKISIDSATMMNKALEVIEAHHLFEMPSDKIDVVIHPQSIVHSFVEYDDGSVLAQLGAADMRTPIAYALAWPNRMQTTGKRLDLLTMGDLTFEAVDMIRFPSMALARQCLKAGQGACLTFNTANEITVEAFLNKRIHFADILPIIEKTLQNHNVANATTLDEIFESDTSVRRLAQSYINSI